MLVYREIRGFMGAKLGNKALQSHPPSGRSGNVGSHKPLIFLKRTLTGVLIRGEPWNSGAAIHGQGQFADTPLSALLQRNIDDLTGIGLLLFGNVS